MQTWLTQEQHFALIGLRNEIEKRARDLRSAEYPRYVGHAEDLRRAELRATALGMLLKEIAIDSQTGRGPMSTKEHVEALRKLREVLDSCEYQWSCETSPEETQAMREALDELLPEAGKEPWRPGYE